MHTYLNDHSPLGIFRVNETNNWYIKHSKECFIRYPNTSKFVKKSRLRLVFFMPLLGVWISYETLFLVFNISHTAFSGKFLMAAYDIHSSTLQEYTL